ncbi:hypothetical protein [Tepidibacter sp. Z1-5]|uniref:hypothetical protein n=1 Tax=Tepidibacter sp. Z1-5 TaxID=3134138 RepID=UPI0030BFC065
MKKIISTLLTLILFTSFLITPIYGQEEGVVAEEKIIATKNLEIKSSRRANNYIVNCEATIDDLGRSRILISALTETVSKVDTLKLKVSLQKQRGSSWTNIRSWNESNSNDDEINFETIYTDASSGKYRVKVSHIITENGKTETEQSTTSSINVK